MAQSGLDLPPASRQDIISALLNDYGNSFGGDNSSPRGYSPLPTPKNLPPTPLEYSHAQSSIKDKPLPPLVRMSMRFQLRVDDPPSPGSPDGSRSSTDSQPKKIISRRLTRSSKPPSLKLTVSNGSTAIVPATPSLPQSSSVSAAKSQDEGKALPPPPPPEKSERRQQRQESTGDLSIAERPPRKDSLGSQSSESAGPVKRKPLPKFTSLAQLGNGPRGGKGGPLPPAPRLQKQSLDEGKDRGNSGRSASAIETSTTRKESDDLSEEQTGNQRSFSAIEKPGNTRQSQESPNESVAMPPEMEIQEEDIPHRTTRASGRQLPPTPDEIVIPAPPPRKPFGGMGLPSNPRAKGQHSRGKSSTGFNFMKSSKAVSEPQALIVETITPDPTPSPGRTEEAQARPASPTSPVRDTSERRPFSFEAIPPHVPNHTKSEAAAPPPPPKSEAAPAPQKEEVTSVALPPHVPQNHYSPIPTIEVQNPSQPFLPRTTSRNSPVAPTLPVEQQPQEQQSSLASLSGNSSRIPPAFASLPSQQRLQQKSPAPQASMPSRVPLAFASLPSQQRFRDDEDDSATPPPVKDAPSEPQSSTTSTQNVARDEAPTSPPPFTPLTRHPVDQPAPPLASKQLNCYSYHATFVWSRNTFQPMACMVCKVNDKERKWSCVWCHLRICVACSTELMKIPGRNLKTLVGSRGVDVVIQGEQGSTDQTATPKQMRRDDMKRHDSGAGGTVGTPTVVVWGAEGDYKGHDFS